MHLVSAIKLWFWLKPFCVLYFLSFSFIRSVNIDRQVKECWFKCKSRERKKERKKYLKGLTIKACWSPVYHRLCNRSHIDDKRPKFFNFSIWSKRYAVGQSSIYFHFHFVCITPTQQSFISYLLRLCLPLLLFFSPFFSISHILSICQMRKWDWNKCQ